MTHNKASVRTDLHMLLTLGVVFPVLCWSGIMAADSVYQTKVLFTSAVVSSLIFLFLLCLFSKSPAINHHVGISPINKYVYILCFNTIIYIIVGDALCVICVPFLYCDKCFRSMEVEGMTLISVMMMVVEGSQNMMRKGQILFYITNKKCMVLASIWNTLICFKM